MQIFFENLEHYFSATSQLHNFFSVRLMFVFYTEQKANARVVFVEKRLNLKTYPQRRKMWFVLVHLLTF